MIDERWRNVPLGELPPEVLDEFYEEFRPQQEEVARQWIESVRAERARAERQARNSDRAVTIALIALGISAASAATGIAVLLIQLWA